MPMGTRHTVTGLLRWDDRNRIHRLELGDGAFWFVDVTGRTRQLLGKQVTVEGTRSGFNQLDVDQLWDADGPPSQRFSLLAVLRRTWGRIGTANRA